MLFEKQLIVGITHLLFKLDYAMVCCYLFYQKCVFFVAFFWAFFHSSLSPTIEIGSIWPPEGFVTFNPWGVPFLNTVLLLSSGATITAAHHFIVVGKFRPAVQMLDLTLSFAIVFTALQALEYVESPFTIADGIYGSTFFMATGFHGFSCYNWYYYDSCYDISVVPWSFYS
jgi:heme/copper-type cytochrome/quinol oxidase subunit 3